MPPRFIVFDSGMGGLTVARAIRNRLPQAQILYAVDNAGFPYGALPDQTLIARVLAVIEAALAEIGACDAIVIACNTASTMVLGPLRARHQIPIVGVVPAVKWAATLSATRQIGVLATAATASRDYLADLIARFAADCTVHVQGAANLAAYAEQDFLGHPVPDELIAAEVAPLFAHADAPAIDYVALGCTHYPLLLPRLARLFSGRRFLDPADAVAKRVAEVDLPGGAWAGRVPPNRTLLTAEPPTTMQGLIREGLPLHGILETGNLGKI